MKSTLKAVRHLVIMASLLSVQSACTYLNTNVIEKLPSADSSSATIKCGFSGLQKHLANKSRKIHIIAVHGMGPHWTNWSCDMRKRVMGQVGLSNPADKLICKEEDKKKADDAITLELPYFDANHDERVRLYELTYSDVIKEYTDSLIYDKDYDHYRVALQRHIKTGSDSQPGLMNDNISNAFAYLGLANERVHKVIDNALKRVGQKMEGDDIAIFIVQSLGSKVTFDVLTKNGAIKISNIDSGMKKIIEGTEQVWLVSNQLPLLELGRERTGIHNLLDFKKELIGQKAADAKGKTEVIAISDPNDLLTYPLDAKAYKDYPNTDFYNVLINNNRWAILGVAVEPYNAHLGYLKNNRVLDIIANGGNCSN